MREPAGLVGWGGGLGPQAPVMVAVLWACQSQATGCGLPLTGPSIIGHHCNAASNGVQHFSLAIPQSPRRAKSGNDIVC